MDSLGFRKWLDEVKADKPANYRKDLVCRAGRVEKAFKVFNEQFSLDKEFKKDGGDRLLQKFKLKGKELEGKPINLPVGTVHMCDFTTAVRWYFKYKSEKEGK